MDTETTKRTRLETKQRHSWGKRQRRPNTWATGAVRRCEENQSKGRDREKTTVLENFLEIKKKKRFASSYLKILYTLYGIDGIVVSVAAFQRYLR